MKKPPQEKEFVGIEGFAKVVNGKLNLMGESPPHNDPVEP